MTCRPAVEPEDRQGAGFIRAAMRGVLTHLGAERDRSAERVLHHGGHPSRPQASTTGSLPAHWPGGIKVLVSTILVHNNSSNGANPGIISAASMAGSRSPVAGVAMGNRCTAIRSRRAWAACLRTAAHRTATSLAPPPAELAQVAPRARRLGAGASFTWHRCWLISRATWRTGVRRRSRTRRCFKTKTAFAWWPDATSVSHGSLLLRREAI